MGYPGIVSVIALVFAMSGGAFAAKYIITKKSQIKPSVWKQLKGKTGPEGPQGPAGANGTNGTNGKDGAKGADGTNGTDGTNSTDVFVKGFIAGGSVQYIWEPETTSATEDTGAGTTGALLIGTSSGEAAGTGTFAVTAP